jgi:hypothetical protein
MQIKIPLQFFYTFHHTRLFPMLLSIAILTSDL